MQGYADQTSVLTNVYETEAFPWDRGCLSKVCSETALYRVISSGNQVEANDLTKPL